MQKPAAPQVPFELARLQRDFPVTLYTSPSCKEGCDLSRLALNRRGVPFKEVQVWDPESSDELKKLTGDNRVPTLMVGRTVQKGFEQGAFEKLLDVAGYPKTGSVQAGKQGAPAVPEGYNGPGATPAPTPAPPESEAKPPAR